VQAVSEEHICAAAYWPVISSETIRNQALSVGKKSKQFIPFARQFHADEKVCHRLRQFSPRLEVSLFGF
jgi:hypothetical protein